MKANPNAPETLALVQAAQQADRVSDDLLAGEATRGLLLTGYGFNVMGDRLAQAAMVCFVLAGLLVIAGIVLLFVPKRKQPAAPISPSPA